MGRRLIALWALASDTANPEASNTITTSKDWIILSTVGVLSVELHFGSRYMRGPQRNIPVIRMSNTLNLDAAVYFVKASAPHTVEMKLAPDFICGDV